MKAIAHTDGGNRSDVACCAAVLLREDGEAFERSRIFPGSWTNNEMEYAGVILAIGAALTYGVTQLQIFSDSELIVKQLTGDYKVKDTQLKVLCREAIDLARELDDISIAHVPREKNLYPDVICNIEMDFFLQRNRPSMKKRLEICRKFPPDGLPRPQLYVGQLRSDRL